ncbi:MAG: hypothetical protein ACKPKO_36560, partial [Candidatus Fonsibacter sp.]
NDPMSGVTTQLMTTSRSDIKQVLAQQHIIAELLMEGQYIDWINFVINKFTDILNNNKAALSTTNATKDSRNMIICCVGMRNADWTHAEIICLDVKVFSVCTPIILHVGLIIAPLSI